MKKYISPIVEMRMLLSVDIVTMSDWAADKVTTFFEDDWGIRFGE